MTPNAIEILIHCFVCPEPHPRCHAPAVVDELDRLEHNGLIEKVEGHTNVFTTTDRGNAHIEQLCRLPWPTKAWIGANGKPLLVST